MKDPEGYFFNWIFDIDPAEVVERTLNPVGVAKTLIDNSFLIHVHNAELELLKVLPEEVRLAVGYAMMLCCGPAGAFKGTYIITGGDIGASVISLVTSVATAEVGSAFQSSTVSTFFASYGSTLGPVLETAAKAVAHGVVGGISSELRGNDFLQGFLSAGTTAAFAPVIDKLPFAELRVLAAAGIGGVTAELGGGKFASGAMTGAFVRLFNHEFHDDPYSGGKSWLHDKIDDACPSSAGYSLFGCIAEAVGLGNALGVTETGATVFKTGHYSSRLEAAGVNVSRAESAVAEEVAAMRPNMATGADVGGRIRIDNVLVEYRARLLPDGSVNVGTIFPVQ